MTEKMRVSASSVMSSVAETSAIPARWRVIGRARSPRHAVISLSIGDECYDAIVDVLRRGFVALSVGVGGCCCRSRRSRRRSRRRPRSWYALAFVVYGAGSVVCHQLPARSFHCGRRRGRSARAAPGSISVRRSTVVAYVASGFEAGPCDDRARQPGARACSRSRRCRRR